MARGKTEARIRVPAGGFPLSLNDSGGGGPYIVTVPAGDYYWSSPGSGSNDFAAELKAQLDASSSAGVFTVNTSAITELGTGKITISATGVSSFTITWTSPTLRDLCGYSGNLSGAASYAAPYQVKGLWISDCPYLNLGGPLFPGVYEADVYANEAVDGTGTRFVWGGKRVGHLEYQASADAKMLSALEATANTSNESLETFWRDAVLGRASWGSEVVRWHPDASVDGTYFTYRWLDPIDRFEPMAIVEGWAGAFRFRVNRLIQLP